LKSKGHPIGATGVSMHVLAAMQLTEAAGGMQVKDPRLGGLFNMGGTAVAELAENLPQGHPGTSCADTWRSAPCARQRRSRCRGRRSAWRKRDRR